MNKEFAPIIDGNIYEYRTKIYPMQKQLAEAEGAGNGFYFQSELRR